MADIVLTAVDWPALKRVLGQSPQLKQLMRQRLSEGAAYARGISPTGGASGQSYKDSFVVDVGQFPDGLPVGHLANTDYKALWVEKGTGQGGPRPQHGSSPAYHVLSRTLTHLNQS